MLLIFALGAVFGAILGAFALALITACMDYVRRPELPAPDRQPRRYSTPEDRRPPMHMRDR